MMLFHTDGLRLMFSVLQDVEGYLGLFSICLSANA